MITAKVVTALAAACLGGTLVVSLAYSAVALERVSVSSNGAQGNHDSYDWSISPDGRSVPFVSEATNLVAGDTNGATDVFVRDRRAESTERVSVNSSAAQGNGDSEGGSLSADARYVAFYSGASNLVAGDTNDTDDVFVRDRQTGRTERISVNSSAAQSDGSSSGGSVSADGRYVAFDSEATNLVAGDTNGRWDVFVRDPRTGRTERVSVNSGAAQASHDSYDGSVSADGRYVAFESVAANLVAGDTNGATDVFVHDRHTGRTERVSVTSGSAQGNGDSDGGALSADGRYVAFFSVAANLVAGDTNGTGDVFLRDRRTGRTERISVNSSGVQGNGSSAAPSLSAHGRHVAFVSGASNLVCGDTNGTGDVFLRDRRTGRTKRISVDRTGAQGNGWSAGPSLSADGRHVAFTSVASNLVAGDTNGKMDAFVMTRGIR
jgi:Tol biopolymer transport system component